MKPHLPASLPAAGREFTEKKKETLWTLWLVFDKTNLI